VDKSFGGLFLEQTTPAAQPSYYTSDFGSNSSAYVSFDGDDFLSESVANFRGSDSAGTITFVFRIPSDGGFYVLTSSDQSSGNRYVTTGVSFNEEGDIYVQQNNANPTYDLLYGQPTEVNKPHRAFVMSDGSDYFIYTDGSDNTLTAFRGGDTGDWYGDTASRDNLVVGALTRTATSGHFVGDLAEIIVFDAALDENDLAAVDAYLNQKYFNDMQEDGITIRIR